LGIISERERKERDPEEKKSETLKKEVKQGWERDTSRLSKKASNQRRKYLAL